VIKGLHFYKCLYASDFEEGCFFIFIVKEDLVIWSCIINLFRIILTMIIFINADETFSW
jgi:hypothetical protein